MGSTTSVKQDQQQLYKTEIEKLSKDAESGFVRYKGALSSVVSDRKIFNSDLTSPICYERTATVVILNDRPDRVQWACMAVAPNPNKQSLFQKLDGIGELLKNSLPSGWALEYPTDENLRFFAVHRPKNLILTLHVQPYGDQNFSGFFNMVGTNP